MVVIRAVGTLTTTIGLIDAFPTDDRACLVAIKDTGNREEWAAYGLSDEEKRL
jgi:hypothetical protein